MDKGKMLYDLQRLNAIADAGLHYGKDVFDLERYGELKEVTADLIENLELVDSSELEELKKPLGKYPTPSVDVRVFVVKDDKILLVKDMRGGEWALPGGYAEVGTSLEKNVLKELYEEAGMSGSINRLLAIFDTNKYNPQLTQYYKAIFLVDELSFDFKENSETDDFGYFSMEELPKLSNLRNSQEQLEICFDLYKSGDILID